MQGWPFFELEIRTPRLILRVPDDAGVAALADLAAKGMHAPDTMPFSTPWSATDPETRRQRVLQWHWKTRGELTPAAWTLGFVAWEDGVPIGTQDIVAAEFAVRRSFETGSWIGLDHQGRGLGKEMRAAVLHLAFAGLGAQEAYTGAFADNQRSQGVTRALGYERNGQHIATRAVIADGVQVGEEAATLHEYRLTRDEWEKRRRDDIEVVGLEPCLPLLGLTT